MHHHRLLGGVNGQLAIGTREGAVLSSGAATVLYLGGHQVRAP